MGIQRARPKPCPHEQTHIRIMKPRNLCLQTQDHSCIQEFLKQYAIISIIHTVAFLYGTKLCRYDNVTDCMGQSYVGMTLLQKYSQLHTALNLMVYRHTHGDKMEDLHYRNQPEIWHGCMQAHIFQSLHKTINSLENIVHYSKIRRMSTPSYSTYMSLKLFFCNLIWSLLHDCLEE